MKENARVLERRYLKVSMIIDHKSQHVVLGKLKFEYV